jgi:hypothetical protein
VQAPDKGEAVIRVEGYVIVGPISSWDEKHREQIIADTAFQSFGKTPYETWLRHLGGWREGFDRGDMSRRVQFYFDRGYRLKKATMEIEVD